MHQLMHARCAGLDVHKKTVVACVLITKADASPLTWARWQRERGSGKGILGKGISGAGMVASRSGFVNRS